MHILLTWETPCGDSSSAISSSLTFLSTLVLMTPFLELRDLWGEAFIPMFASMVARSKLSAWAFFPHSISICPERSFLMSFTAPAMPLIPFSIVKGDKLLRGAESSVELSTMKLANIRFSSLSLNPSLTSNVFLGLKVEESIVRFGYVLVCSSPLLPTCHGALLGDVKSRGFPADYTPRIQGWYTQAMTSTT